MSHSFANSAYERHENDHYPTIDERCLIALQSAWDVPTPAYDWCVGPNGESGLVEQAPYLFTDQINSARAIITNPPYRKDIVDEVMTLIVGCVGKGECVMAAALLRTQWDHAKTRAQFFDHPHFAGLLRLRFRPWWTTDRKASPIHNYQWVIWDERHSGEPVVRYAGSGA
jgi:hypothetical protein